MAKFNLTIPDELKARMDRFPKSNWSHVAREAFNNELIKLESTQEVESMAQAISRLKASREKTGAEVEKDGFRDGHIWAMKYAEYDHLKRLDKYNDELTSTTSLVLDYDGFMRAVTNSNNESVYVFDERAPIENIDYLVGFFDGALSVYSEVDNSPH